MMTPQLLSPKKIFIRTYNNIDYISMLKLLRAGKVKKYGFLEVAYNVEELFNNCYNVRIEYMVKE